MFSSLRTCLADALFRNIQNHCQSLHDYTERLLQLEILHSLSTLSRFYAPIYIPIKVSSLHRNQAACHFGLVVLRNSLHRIETMYILIICQTSLTTGYIAKVNGTNQHNKVGNKPLEMYT